MVEIAIRDINIPASDGLALAATVFEPDLSAAMVVIIGSATAVPRGYYRRFASWLAGAGVQVVTFDYRGIGGSQPASFKASDARMRDWGERDCRGVLAWAQSMSPRRSIRWIGHSYGGFGPALADNAEVVDRFLAVATMSGYWGHMQGFEAMKVATAMGLVVPTAAMTFGYVPGQIFGGAEHLPKGIALEFSRWCMSPGFFFDDPTLAAREKFARITAPICFCRPLDDPWCTEPALTALARHFTSAETEHWQADPAQAGGPIGHVGFFRDRFRDTLWPRARDWITARSAVTQDRHDVRDDPARRYALSLKRSPSAQESVGR